MTAAAAAQNTMTATAAAQNIMTASAPARDILTASTETLETLILSQMSGWKYSRPGLPRKQPMPLEGLTERVENRFLHALPIYS